MSYRLPAVLFLGLFSVSALRAQTAPGYTVIPQQQTWLGYLNQTRLSKHWGLWLDVHTRRTSAFLDRWSMHVVRPGIIYYPSDNIRVVGGYTFARLYAQTTPAPTRTEHRPWQQISVDTRYGRLLTTQRLRIEERFIQRTSGSELLDTYGFNWRFRLMLTLQYPLTRSTTARHVPLAVFQNEVMVNAGRQITYNVFDQNRLFVGVTYPVTKTLSVQAGYMNQFVQQPSGNAFVSNHVARVFVIHNLSVERNRTAKAE